MTTITTASPRPVSRRGKRSLGRTLAIVAVAVVATLGTAGCQLTQEFTDAWGL